MKLVTLIKPNRTKLILSIIAGVISIIIFYSLREAPYCLAVMPNNCKECTGIQYPNLIRQCYDGCDCSDFEEFASETIQAIIGPFLLGFVGTYFLTSLIQVVKSRK